MGKVAALSCILCVASTACFAQTWAPWSDDRFGFRSDDPFRYRYSDPDRRGQARDTPFVTEEQRIPRASADVRYGGPRPEIGPVAPPTVSFPHDFPANSIVIDTGGRALYYVLPDQRAYAYPISVGREGFNWTGTETISRKQRWPDWYPPLEMRQRDRSLPVKMTGGIKNPLGALALYLGDTLYRIHGTNDVTSIGQAQSSGCFRMLNSAVMHLSSIAEVGTTVTVVSSLPQRQEVSHAAEPTPSHQPQLQLRPQQQPQIPEQRTTAPRSEGHSSPGQVFDYQALRDYTLRR